MTELSTPILDKDIGDDLSGATDSSSESTSNNKKIKKQSSGKKQKESLEVNPLNAKIQ